jgi:hypothetical protein
MRKILIAALAVFSLAFAIGLITAEHAQAAKCWWQCGCNGEALYCCRSGPIVNCKVVVNPPINCPQVADC